MLVLANRLLYPLAQYIIWARGAQGERVSGEEGVEGPSRPQRSLRGIKAYVPSETYIEMTLVTQYGMVTGRGPRTYSQLLVEAFKEWLENHKEVKQYVETNKPVLERAMKGQEVGA
jgi:hypothetical protein